MPATVHIDGSVEEQEVAGRRVLEQQGVGFRSAVDRPCDTRCGIEAAVGADAITGEDAGEQLGSGREGAWQLATSPA